MLLVLIVIVIGCEEDDQGPLRCSDMAGVTQLPDVPLRHSTEHLDIYVDDDRMLCAGTAKEYERFYQYVGVELGVDLPTRTPVFSSDVFVEYCPRGSWGCRTVDGVVFTNPGATFHELAHAATCEWRNGSSKYLNEGLAVAFDVTPLKIAAPKYWIDPIEYLPIGWGEPFGLHYEDAGHLVRWLLDTRGPEAFRVLFETSPRAGGPGVFDALTSAYGQDADALLTEYETSAPYMWVPHRQCADLEVLAPIDGAWEFNRVFDCDDPATMGPWEREGHWTNFDALAPTTMYQSVLLEIEKPGVYQFQTAAGTLIEIERCIDDVSLTEEQADALWLHDLLFPGLHWTSDIELPAATYRVDIQRQYAEPHPVWLRIVPSPG